MVQTLMESMSRVKSKRDDPSYTKITVDVSKSTTAKMRAICALMDINFSEGVDEALADWVNKQKNKQKDLEI